MSDAIEGRRRRFDKPASSDKQAIDSSSGAALGTDRSTLPDRSSSIEVMITGIKRNSLLRFSVIVVGAAIVGFAACRRQ
jgi:hypothetical protein